MIIKKEGASVHEGQSRVVAVVMLISLWRRRKRRKVKLLI